jgi:hypothetical protein
MDEADEAAAMAKELTRHNASAKGFRSQFVLTRNVLVQALPLYDEADNARSAQPLIRQGCKLTRYTTPISGSSSLTPMNATTTTYMSASNSLVTSTIT